MSFWWWTTWWMAEGMTEKKSFVGIRFGVRALAAPVARLRGVFGEIDRGPLAYSRRPFSTFNRLARPSPAPPPPRPSPTSIADAAATRTPRKRDTPPPTLVLRSPPSTTPSPPRDDDSPSAWVRTSCPRRSRVRRHTAAGSTDATTAAPPHGNDRAARNYAPGKDGVRSRSPNSLIKYIIVIAIIILLYWPRYLRYHCVDDVELSRPPPVDRSCCCIYSRLRR